MAGTINLSLSQQFNSAGKPLSGGKLYFYQAATTTPQNAYKDTALTLVHPNPIILDSSGRVPEFWLADGNIKFVLTDKNGLVQIFSISTQVLGPSSGSGSGSTVDATTIFQTGDVMWLDVSGARTGWVRDNGRTIGSATSGASERANSDCQLLYVYLWTTYSDTLCPVNGGRGLSAAADWAANKYITLPDKRGRSPFGVDDMGNAAASRLSGVAFTSGNATTAGSLGGAATRTLTKAQLPALGLTAATAVTLTGGATQVARSANTGGFQAGNSANTFLSGTAAGGDFGAITATATTTVTDSNGGLAHETMNPFVLGTFYRKL
jgi:microcystin-dependent protein